MSDETEEEEITFQREDYCFIKLKNKTQHMGKVNIQVIDEETFIFIYDPIEVGYELDPDYEEPMMYFMNPLFATKQDCLPLLMEDLEFFGELNDAYYEMYIQHTGLEMDIGDLKIDGKNIDKEPTKRKGNVFYLGKGKKD